MQRGCGGRARLPTERGVRGGARPQRPGPPPGPEPRADAPPTQPPRRPTWDSPEQASRPETAGGCAPEGPDRAHQEGTGSRRAGSSEGFLPLTVPCPWGCPATATPHTCPCAYSVGSLFTFRPPQPGDLGLRTQPDSESATRICKAGQCERVNVPSVRGVGGGVCRNLDFVRPPGVRLQ